MPAVAQINVNFANRQEFTTRVPSDGMSTVKSISPYTLTQYLLFNRENAVYGKTYQNLQPPGVNDIEYLTYSGGFITAGNKVNVKHTDFQITSDRSPGVTNSGNLDVENSIYVDRICARRKGNTSSTYQANRSGADRSIKLTPRPGEETSHVIEINSPTANEKEIKLLAKGTTETSVTLTNNSTTNSIVINVTDFTLNNSSTRITGTLEVVGNTTFQKNVTIIGSSTAGQELFTIKKNNTTDTFKVDSASGDVTFIGDLDINGKFTVDSASGDTSISRDLTVTRDVTINDNLYVTNTSEFYNHISMGEGNPQAETRRIIGIRRVSTNNNLQDIYDPSSDYLNDPLAIGDFRTFFYQTPKIVSGSSYTAVNDDNQKTILINNGGNAFEIRLPANLSLGLQISFIRLGSADVRFVSVGGTTIRSTPTHLFTRLAFQYSVATFFLGKANEYFLFGDLLP